MADRLHPEAHDLWGFVLEYGKGEQYSLELVADALGVAIAEAGGTRKGEILKRVCQAADVAHDEGGRHDRFH